MPRIILSAELLGFLILLGTPGIYISYQKGRNMLEWFVLGAFLGPIGWLIELLLPTRNRS